MAKTPKRDWEPTATSMTLLQSLRVSLDDEASWKRFVARYEPLILKWCAQRGLAADDAADVSQNVMLRMATFIREFEYDSNKSFRAWLKTVTHNAWHDWAAKENRHRVHVQHEDVLATVEARDDLVHRLQREYDAEVMELAVLRVQLRVSAPVWKAFELTAIDGMTGTEAATKLKIGTAKLYVDKSRVTRFLKEEIQKLEPNDPAGEAAS